MNMDLAMRYSFGAVALDLMGGADGTERDFCEAFSGVGAVAYSADDLPADLGPAASTRRISRPNRGGPRVLCRRAPQKTQALVSCVHHKPHNVLSRHLQELSRKNILKPYETN